MKRRSVVVVGGLYFDVDGCVDRQAVRKGRERRGKVKNGRGSTRCNGKGVWGDGRRKTVSGAPSVKVKDWTHECFGFGVREGKKREEDRKLSKMHRSRVAGLGRDEAESPFSPCKLHGRTRGPSGRSLISKIFCSAAGSTVEREKSQR